MSMDVCRLSVKQKKGKKVKDPNKPKRPPSAFFVFMYVSAFSALLDFDF